MFFSVSLCIHFLTKSHLSDYMIFFLDTKYFYSPKLPLFFLAFLLFSSLFHDPFTQNNQIRQSLFFSTPFTYSMLAAVRFQRRLSLLYAPYSCLFLNVSSSYLVVPLFYKLCSQAHAPLTFNHCFRRDKIVQRFFFFSLHDFGNQVSPQFAVLSSS